MDSAKNMGSGKKREIVGKKVLKNQKVKKKYRDSGEKRQWKKK